MDELLDLIATDKSPSEITDQIKDALYVKASERINAQKPDVAASMFDFSADEEGSEDAEEVSDEPVDELEDSTEEEEES
tara:strand:- start:586 stop:822 length:237 start_codon:yes stop_codon:yes gene_type:complete